MFKRMDMMLCRIILGAILFVIGLCFPTINLTMYFLSYVILSYDVIWEATQKIIKGKLFDESFLMTLATIGALVIKEYPEAIAVMLFFQLGEYIQDKAVDHSKKSISSLVKMRNDLVHIKKDGKELDVDPRMVAIGQTIYVKPGERISLDGEIMDGTSTLDMSALTGEAIPVSVKKDDQVLSGSVNLTGYLVIRVTTDYKNSTVSRILGLMEEAISSKTKTERFITKFSRIYTPIVVLLAFLIFLIPTLGGGDIQEWIYRAFIFLVISCPCALVISIPLGFFSGLGVASKKGILMKGSNHLEVLTRVNTVVLDKTGTITSGTFQVRKIVPNAKEQDDVLKYAALAELHSNHPIAYAIRSAYSKEIREEEVENVEEFSGYGVKAMVEGKEVFVGNTKFLEKNKIKVVHVRQKGTVVHVAVDNEYYGYLLIADQIKPGMSEFFKQLRKENVDKIVILSGDNEDIVKKVGKEVGADEAYGSLLPDEKVHYMKELMKDPKNVTLFMGDGMNDAPVLASAHLGVSMGGIGSDAAIEASDIVLMHDDPTALLTGIYIGKKTLKIVWQNIILSIGVKVAVLLLGAFGFTTIWGAVFADVGITILAILNSMRILKMK